MSRTGRVQESELESKNYSSDVFFRIVEIPTALVKDEETGIMSALRDWRCARLCCKAAVVT
jgi:hypothetical protein